MSNQDTDLPIPINSVEEWIPPEVAETFHVHDDGSANWLIRKVVEARAYAERCAAWAERERRRAQRDEEFLLFRYGVQLRDYLRRKLAEQGGRRKSVALPSGTAGFRTQAAKMVVDDEHAVIDWARVKSPEAVQIIERLSKSALDAHIEATGELPPVGVHVEPEHEKFYVK